MNVAATCVDGDFYIASPCSTSPSATISILQSSSGLIIQYLRLSLDFCLDEGLLVTTNGKERDDDPSFRVIMCQNSSCLCVITNTGMILSYACITGHSGGIDSFSSPFVSASTSYKEGIGMKKRGKGLLLPHWVPLNAVSSNVHPSSSLSSSSTSSLLPSEKFGLWAQSASFAYPFLLGKCNNSNTDIDVDVDESNESLLLFHIRSAVAIPLLIPREHFKHHTLDSRKESNVQSKSDSEEKFNTSSTLNTLNITHSSISSCGGFAAIVIEMTSASNLKSTKLLIIDLQYVYSTCEIDPSNHTKPLPASSCLSQSCYHSHSPSSTMALMHTHYDNEFHLNESTMLTVPIADCPVSQLSWKSRVGSGNGVGGGSGNIEMLMAHTTNHRIKIWAVARIPPPISLTPTSYPQSFSFSHATTTTTASGGVSHVFHLPSEESIPDVLPEIHLVADFLSAPEPTSSSSSSSSSTSETLSCSQVLVNWLHPVVCPGSELAFLRDNSLIRETIHSNTSSSTSSNPSSISHPLNASSSSSSSPLVKSYGSMIGAWIAIATPLQMTETLKSNANVVNSTCNARQTQSTAFTNSSSLTHVPSLYDVRFIPIHPFTLSSSSTSSSSYSLLPIQGSSSLSSSVTRTTDLFLTNATPSLLLYLSMPMQSFFLLGRFAANGIGNPISVHGICMSELISTIKSNDNNSYEGPSNQPSYTVRNELECTVVSGNLSTVNSVGSGMTSKQGNSCVPTSIMSRAFTTVMSTRKMYLKGFISETFMSPNAKYNVKLINNESEALAVAEAQAQAQRYSFTKFSHLADLLPYHGYREVMIQPFASRHSSLALTLCPSNTPSLTFPLRTHSGKRATLNEKRGSGQWSNYDALGLMEEGLLDVCAKADEKDESHASVSNANMKSSVSVLRCLYMKSPSSNPLGTQNEKMIVALRKHVSSKAEGMKLQRDTSDRGNDSNDILKERDTFDIAIWALRPAPPLPYIPLQTNADPILHAASEMEATNLNADLYEYCTLDVIPDAHFGLGLRLDLVGGQQGPDGSKIGGSVIVHSFKRNPINGTQRNSYSNTPISVIFYVYIYLHITSNIQYNHTFCHVNFTTCFNRGTSWR